MSKRKKEGNSLHPLQRQIVLNLSKNGPQTINKTVKNINHSYKPSWTAFNSLEEKGLLTKVGTYDYHGNKFPEFWLTELGILTAILEGASPTDLLAQSREVYPDNQMLQYFLEMIPNFNQDIVRIAFTALKNKGKLEPADLVSIMITQMQTDAPMKTFIRALETLRKYPKEYKQFKQNITQIRENFNKLMENV